MKQIEGNLSNLPVVDSFKHLILCINYLSNWSETKIIKDKPVPIVASFSYEIVCRNGCIKIQKKNHENKQFVNQATENLHKMIGTAQRIVSAYHPQSNGLYERQNRIIKDSLIKVLEGKTDHCPDVIDGVLFVHRVGVHTSTKYSSFFFTAQ